MKDNTKKGIVALMGGLGVIALLLGIFTNVYQFGTGLLIAIAIWIVTGAVSIMMGVKKN